jgi:hypothetical protein
LSVFSIGKAGFGFDGSNGTNPANGGTPGLRLPWAMSSGSGCDLKECGPFRRFPVFGFGIDRPRLFTINHFKNNPMDHNLTLGQLCHIDHMLYRKMAGWEKLWEPIKLKAPIPGIVVGIRTLSNGTTYSLGEGYGNGYEAKEYFRAVLVATDLHRKPVLVKFIL